MIKYFQIDLQHDYMTVVKQSLLVSQCRHLEFIDFIVYIYTYYIKYTNYNSWFTVNYNPTV